MAIEDEARTIGALSKSLRHPTHSKLRWRAALVSLLLQTSNFLHRRSMILFSYEDIITCHLSYSLGHRSFPPPPKFFSTYYSCSFFLSFLFYGSLHVNPPSFLRIHPSSRASKQQSKRLGMATKRLYSSEKPNIAVFIFLALGSADSVILNARTSLASKALPNSVSFRLQALDQD